MNPPAGSALAVRGLTYTYPDAASPALEGVDLTVEEGEFVLLVGASGCGKSTLLRAASGLVPHFHGGEFAGNVSVLGKDTRRFKPAELADGVATLFQDPEAQIVMGSVDAELALGLEQRGAPPEAIARATEEVALALGIPDLRGRSTQELSGGELQRVALGAVLAPNPRLALFDEPTSQLDPIAGDELIGLIARLNQEHGLTVILSEHRLERCMKAVDRVVALDAGRVAFDARPQEFLEWAVTEAPRLATSIARMFHGAGISPPPTSVKGARIRLRELGVRLGTSGDWSARSAERDGDRGRGTGRAGRRSRRTDPAVDVRGVWHELDDGTSTGWPVLQGIDLAVEAGERVALLGRNGAGKSTLLKHLNGILLPTRGRVRISGRDTRSVPQREMAGSVALLMQNPNDYLLHDRVRDELPADRADGALEAVGLARHAESNPRDLSGGERQRLAVAVVLAGRGIPGGRPPAVVALDEPTRGLDRDDKAKLAALLRRLSEEGAAVIVASHDVELAASFSNRVVVLGDGRLIADGPPGRVLSGGWYFATEVARALGGIDGAALPESGAAVIERFIGKGAASP